MARCMSQFELNMYPPEIRESVVFDPRLAVETDGLASVIQHLPPGHAPATVRMRPRELSRLRQPRSVTVGSPGTLSVKWSRIRRLYGSQVTSSTSAFAGSPWSIRK